VLMVSMECRVSKIESVRLKVWVRTEKCVCAHGPRQDLAPHELLTAPPIRPSDLESY